MAPRIRSLAIKGFRAFGAAEQTLNIPADIAVIWGPNSKGKTSLAEAVEFLLTGRIVRRELMASSQDEFADALRNAHLSVEEEVYVAARLKAADGSLHTFKRILTRDYAKRQQCESVLEIDGIAGSERDLERLGVRFSQPPLRAPILSQHTLSYIFSVRPQDRATYFKTLLDVTDLDEIRNDVAALETHLEEPDDPHLRAFDNCQGRPIIRDQLGALSTAPTLATLTGRISSALAALVETSGNTAPDSFTERIVSLERQLAETRSKTFPVDQFHRQELPGWTPPGPEVWSSLNIYIAERKLVDERTRQLTGLFEKALELPEVLQISEPVECALCGTDSALTPERVRLIRQHVEDTASFKAAEAAAKHALSQLAGLAANVQRDGRSALPGYLRGGAADRRRNGFRVNRLRTLLGERADEFVAPWLRQTRAMTSAASALEQAVQVAANLTSRQAADMSLVDPDQLRSAFDEVAQLHTRFSDRIRSYLEAAQPLIIALNEVLDEAADAAGWEDLLGLAREPEQLRASLVQRAARVSVARELTAAIKEIDRAKEQVLQDKFSDYSDLVAKWWEKLRPDEPTFFDAVKPRKGTKRTIDFKAGLSPDPDRSAPKVRDVIAVFSQSQLHCLGLALFLARSEHEGHGFIVLDDPVLSSDDDYRVHFNATVLSDLLKVPMQVVVLTQDHATWEELETRYRHLGISVAQLYIETAGEGSVIENTSDALLAKINRARSLARGGHPDSRKECGIQLRDAGERFCKEMLMRAEHAGGNVSASLSDYDGKTLEWLCPRVDPLLDRDPSHPGKLAAFKRIVNDACHDNVPPNPGTMTHACGEIAFLQKQYLPR